MLNCSFSEIFNQVWTKILKNSKILKASENREILSENQREVMEF